MATLSKQSLVAGAVSTSAASLVSQVATLAISPVLARVYTAEDFGLYATYSAVSLFLGAIAGLRIEAALTIEATDFEAQASLVVSQLAGLCVTGLAFAVAVVLYAFGAIALFPHLLIAACGAVSAFAFLASQGVGQIALRRLHYHVGAWGRISQVLAQCGAQVAAGALGWGVIGLVGGDLIGRIAGLLVSLLLMPSDVSRPKLSASLIGATWARARPYRTTLLGATLLTSAAYHALPIGLSLAFDAKAAGLFFMAQRAVIMPVMFVGSSLAQVLSAEAAHRKRDGKRIDVLAMQFGVHATWLTLPLILALIMYGPDIAVLVFGEDWRQAGEMMQWLAPMALAYAVASPLSGLLVIGKRFGESVAIGSVDLITKILACVVGAWAQSLGLAVVVVAVSGGGLYLLSVARFLAAAEASIRTLALRTAPILVTGVIILAPAKWVGITFGSGVGMVAAAGLGLSFYGVYIWRHVRFLGARFVLR